MIISATQLADFAFCPHLYYLKHVRKIGMRSRNVWRGIRAHRGAQEVPVQTEIEGVLIRGRADFVEGDAVRELKTASPHFWVNHVTQASVYALGLGKRRIEIDYRKEGLKLTGSPADLEETVARFLEAVRQGKFPKNLKHCSLCYYRHVCR